MPTSSQPGVPSNGWERRRSQRFPTRCEATIVRNGSWTAHGTLAELSLWGLRLSDVALGVDDPTWVPKCLDPAARLWLAMECPPSIVPVRLVGRVVWYESNEAGVAFVSMTTESRVRLWQMVTALGREARGRA